MDSKENIYVTATFQTAIARIYRTNETVIGAGFLVGRNYVLTCAHVVASALDLAATTSDSATQPVYLDFPEIAHGYLQAARVVLWHPQRLDGGDIAGLELESAPPQGTTIIQLLRDLPDLWNHNYRVYGFPEGIDTGIHSTGRILGRQSVTRWMQIEDTKESGRRVEQGYSGAPVWDEQLNGVIGMVVASDREASAKTAFIIPSDILHPLWNVITFQDVKTVGSSWREGLNDTHLQIAIDPASTLCVLAGPGTGKTFALVRRVAQLIDNGSNPQRILLVTFTRACYAL